jgi:putative transcriptional regulator
MTLRYHPSEATLVAYAAGSLSEASSVVVATHLLVCSVCRETVKLADMVGGIMFESAPSRQLSSASLDATVALLDAEPDPRAQYVPAQEDDLSLRGASLGLSGSLPSTLAPYHLGGWRWLAPGVRRIRLPIHRESVGTLDLYRISPGGSLPSHGHGGLEVTCVLQGSFSDQIGHFQPGDIAEMDASLDHQPIADMGGDCICLAAVERPLKMHGFLARLLQPILG